MSVQRYGYIRHNDPNKMLTIDFGPTDEGWLVHYYDYLAAIEKMRAACIRAAMEALMSISTDDPNDFIRDDRGDMLNDYMTAVNEALRKVQP